jgi:hypothetical protein
MSISIFLLTPFQISTCSTINEISNGVKINKADSYNFSQTTNYKPNLEFSVLMLDDEEKNKDDEQNNQEDDFMNYEEYDEYTYGPESKKSPIAAVILAVFPGCAIHGLGHFYVGDKDTGMWLIATELASISIFMSSSKNSFNQYGFRDYDTVAKIGAISFLTSWLYDLIGSPIAAIRVNKKYEYRYAVYPEIRNDQFTMNLSISF